MKNIIYLVPILLLTFSCEKKEFETVTAPETSVAQKSIEELDIPASFDFSTSNEVTVEIIDPSSNNMYSIFTEDESGRSEVGKIFKREGSNSILSLKLPSSVESLIIQKGDSEYEFDILGDYCLAEFSNTSARIASGCYENLYAVNSSGGFYSINSESGDFSETDLGSLQGGGSIACAVDKANKLVYYNVGQTLWKYYIETQTFETVHTGNPFNGSYPRMEFNQTNGLLYIAKNEKMYVVRPSDGFVNSEFDIVGLEQPVSGGDLAISLDGTIYMCCFSGLYKIEIFGSTAYATRISAEELPFKPTSMAIDRNDNLYLATNDANSQLIQMDKVDGAWTVLKSYNHKINDLSSLPCSADELSQVDSDGDGVIDQEDDYPDEAEKAFDLYTPSKLGYGSFGFEDLWPQQGDYDFNDMALNYRYIAVQNSNTETVELQIKVKMLSLNAGLHSGFGISFPFASDRVESVTGSKLEEGIVSLNSNGTEAGHDNAVIIVFEDGFNHGNYGECATQPEDDILITITFSVPLTLEELDVIKFNPFIFIDGQRGKEVHLKNYPPTALADMSLFGQDDDVSDGNLYYTNNEGLPWAIDIIHQIRVPKSGKAINAGYSKFNQWAESGGAAFDDWYKDNSGYRNTTELCVD